MSYKEMKRTQYIKKQVNKYWKRILKKKQGRRKHILKLLKKESGKKYLLLETLKPNCGFESCKIFSALLIYANQWELLYSQIQIEKHVNE